jgi:hypothetical protein
MHLAGSVDLGRRLRLSPRQRVSWLLVVALLALTAALVATTPGPADAHTSTYCGHNRSGTMNVTFFDHHYGNIYHGNPNHGHTTWHDMWWGTDHWKNRIC